MRVAVGTACGNNKIIDSGIPMGAILHYDTADDSEPESTGVTMRTGCDDETNLVPFVPNTVPRSIVPQKELALNHVQDESTDNLFRWTIDGTPQIVNWNQPSLKTTLENGQDYGNNSNLYEIKTKDDVSASSTSMSHLGLTELVVVSVVHSNSNCHPPSPPHPSPRPRFLCCG